ncbi:MAG: ATP-binding protein [Coriobacteriales bacterium]|jgi:predicted AAA+ superfamily ATPase|nr:ATP-binding protein [Coriobacteriales bacterium]
MEKAVIERAISKQLERRLSDNKALVIMGPRQVGKTTALRALIKGRDDVLWLNGDEPDIRMLFEQATSTSLRALIGKAAVMVIDEAQRIIDIGVKLKLITDNITEVKLLATGSSSFELANKINESLAGRKWEYMLYPLSFAELVNHHGMLEERRLLPHRLVYGSYPEVVTSPGDEQELLRELSGSILYKDILTHEGIKNPEKLERLLQALAYQVGGLVSYSELGQTSGLSNKTVERYIDILEKAYIIFRLGSYSKNLRNELKKSRKIYFVDNGIRNALIADYRALEIRSDIGALWENYLMTERRKLCAYNAVQTISRFWRTAQKQEIDLIEVQSGQVNAFEFKWNPKAKVTGIKTFKTSYPESTFNVINRENYEDFLFSL